MAFKILRKISYLLILLSFWACSTKKNTWLSRNYHNLTAYYNVYYNGRESFRVGDKAIVEAYNNDYSDILPLFESSDPDAASVADTEMDRAIEKGKKLIKKHSITAKPKKRSRNNAYAAEFYSKKEFNAWVDDAYVLIGKAQVYKHEQALAIRTLQYVVRDFPDSESMYEALIWQARAFTDKGDYIGALAALESYDLGGHAPAELYADYMAVYANLLLVQEKYTEAIPYLKNAIADENKKHKRLRYTYVLGQLYMQNNQRKEAAEAFAWVAKASADYEMTFNAKVNQASIIYENANVAEVRKQLHKLRKDKKNKDFLDQIYYAFGKVSLQEQDEPEALYNFKKSVETSVGNDNQKGLSYRQVGEIYYARLDFVDAFFYYDSALTVIDDDYEKLEELKERHYGLSGLVDHILTVQREDSLQRLADMSEPVLYAYLDGIIAEKEEEQKRLEKMQEEDLLDDPFFYQNAGVGNNMGQAGKWYFYNQVSMGMGEMEFEKRWGKRKLEDNWRRKDKGKVEEDSGPDDPFDVPDDPFAQIESEEVVDTTKASGDQQKDSYSVDVPTRDELLADIPRTPERRKQSDLKIEAALLELGLVFMDRLENYPKSIEALEELLTRYPRSESRAEAMIALYNAYRLSGDTAGMMVTQSRIENEFPDHRFVAFLNDPEYLQKIQAKKAEQARIYESTYESFLFGHYNEVVAQASIAVDESENILKNKYLLLRGLSYGKQGQLEPFKADLNTIISSDKGSEEAQLAEALLKHIKEGKAPVQGTRFSVSPADVTSTPEVEVHSDGEGQKANFIFVDNEPYELIVMDIKDENLNRAIYHVADYNFSRYLLHDFEIQEKRLLDGSPIVVVSGFSNRIEAMDYFYGLRENHQFFGFDYFTDNIVILSESNNNKFYLSGLVSDYKLFFKKYYLQPVEKSELEKVSVTTPLPKEPQNNSMQNVEEMDTDSTFSKAELLSNDQKKEEAQEALSEQVLVVPEKQAEVEQVPIEETPIKAAVEEAYVDTVTQAPIAESIYSIGNDEKHVVLVVVKKTRMDYNRLQKLFAAHTRNNFGTDIEVQLLELGKSYRMVQVAFLQDAETAKEYIAGVKKLPYLLRDIERREHYIWAVSESNLSKLMESDDMQAYDDFFNANYK